MFSEAELFNSPYLTMSRIYIFIKCCSFENILLKTWIIQITSTNLFSVLSFSLFDPCCSICIKYKKVCESFYFMYWRFYAPENTHYNLRKLCACVTQSYCFSSPIWTFLAPVIVLFDHQLHTHCFMISERVVKKLENAMLEQTSRIAILI